MDFKIEKVSQYSNGVVIDKSVEAVYSYNYPVDEPMPGSWTSPEPVSKVLKVKDWKRRKDYDLIVKDSYEKVMESM